MKTTLPSTDPASPKAQSSAAKIAGRSAPLSEVPPMPSIKSVLVFGIVLLCVGSAALLLSVIPALKQSPNSAAHPVAHAAELQAPESNSATAAVAARSASTVAEPDVSAPPTVQTPAAHWQTPRFLQAFGLPLAIGCTGNHAMVVIRNANLGQVTQEDLNKPADPSALNSLQLMETDDGGQTWQLKQLLKGYSNGAAAYDDAGNCILIAMKPVGSRQVILPSSVFCSDRYGQLDWMIRKAGETEFSAPVTLLTAPEKSAVVYNPKVFCSGGRTWVFALRLKQKADSIGGIRIGSDNFDPNVTTELYAAVGDAGQAPAPVPAPGRGFGTEYPAAWVCDGLNAGVVTATEDRSQLQQSLTPDGGKTWQTRTIPITLPESGAEVQEAIPITVSRCGKDLSLLVNVLVKQPKSLLTISVPVYRGVMLHSSDLGATWGSAMTVTKKVGMDGLTQAGGNGMYGLHRTRENVLFVHSRMNISLNALASAMLSKKNVTLTRSQSNFELPVLVSADSGQTWQNYHAMDAIANQDVVGCAVGGDEKTLHVAMYSNNVMVVRTFTPGDWPQPLAPAPSWYKDEALPLPTPESF